MSSRPSNLAGPRDNPDAQTQHETATTESVYSDSDNTTVESSYSAFEDESGVQRVRCTLTFVRRVAHAKRKSLEPAEDSEDSPQLKKMKTTMQEQIAKQEEEEEEEEGSDAALTEDTDNLTIESRYSSFEDESGTHRVRCHLTWIHRKQIHQEEDEVSDAAPTEYTDNLTIESRYSSFKDECGVQRVRCHLTWVHRSDLAMYEQIPREEEDSDAAPTEDTDNLTIESRYSSFEDESGVQRVRCHLKWVQRSALTKRAHIEEAGKVAKGRADEVKKDRDNKVMLWLKDCEVDD